MIVNDYFQERVQRLAAARQRSAHWLMREAIQQYVDREEKREALRQAALDAWASYQASGLHVTAGFSLCDIPGKPAIEATL